MQGGNEGEIGGTIDTMPSKGQNGDIVNENN